MITKCSFGGAATFSADGLCRYELRRRWTDLLSGGRGCAHFIMLNPSTADEVRNDATIRKCIGFASRLGYSSLVVTNLIPIIQTDPWDLPAWSGFFMENDPYVIEALVTSAVNIVAWGSMHSQLSKKIALSEHILHFKWLLQANRAMCLGVTLDGSPRHPSRLPYLHTHLEPWGGE
jgi:hypothetical protein